MASSVVLLFASSMRTGADYESALRERGFEVVRAASTRSLERQLRDVPIDLVLLDSGTSETQRAIQVLEASGCSVPRLWVSSSPDAPVRSGHFGVDALLIDPDDVVAVIARVERFLTPRGAVEAAHPFMADGTNPPRARPRGTGPVADKGEREREPSTSWDDPTSDWKLKPR
jgi:DNA-binding response OmpR family regulator